MLYLRVVGSTKKKLRFAIWALVGLVILIMVGTTAGLLKFCDPTEKLFDVFVPGTCNINAVLFIAQAALQIFTDLLILIPPIPMVWRLNLSKSRKVQFVGILCIGLL
jgi:hypothetical protein